MNRTPVQNSRNISEIGYDPETRTLEVAFRNGNVYRYRDVDAERHKALMSAPSRGAYLHAYIKGKYPHSQVDAK